MKSIKSKTMKTNQTKVSVIALAMVMMLATVSVKAQGQQGPGGEKEGREMMQRGPHGPHRQGPPPIPGLTEDQKDQMKSIHVETEKASMPVRNQIGEKEARLRTLVTAESYDERAINKTLEEIGDLKTEVEKIKIASLQKVKEVLNDEQLLVFYKHMDQKGKGDGLGHGKGPRGRGR